MNEIKSDELAIIYEDNHIIVVSKPQNVPCCPDETGDGDLFSAVKKYIKEKYSKPGDAYLGLVHRLDRPTGGVMVFAKTSKAAARLSESVKNGDMEKTYLAVTVGKQREKSINGLTDYLLKSPDKNIVRCVPMATEGAKKAVLDYKAVAYDETHNLSLLFVKLHTGRAHQIRVQMANLLTPLFGDMKYGQGKSPIGYNLALWATELKFTHPVTKEKMVFRAYPPVDDIPWKFFEVNRFLAISIKNVY